MQLNLKNKILSMTLLPVVGFMILAAILVNQTWREKRSATGVREAAQAFLATSGFIHEMQRERGVTALYLGGKTPESALEKQRAVLDAKVKAFQEHVTTLDMPEDRRAAALKAVDVLHAIRADVGPKAVPAEISGRFSQNVDTLIAAEIEITKLASMEGTDAMLSSVSMLEVAKESAGRLRASVLNILGQDKPIPAATVEKIDDFKSKVSPNINSPILKISDEGRKGIVDFNGSEEWKKTLATYDVVVAKAGTGKFGQDANEFYKNVTASIDRLGVVVAGEFPPLIEKTEGVAKRAATALAISSMLAAALATVLLILSWRFAKKLSANLENLATQLSGEATAVGSSSGDVATASNQLSASTTEQAAALQETVSSLEEISAMVTKNSDNATKSLEVSNTSQEVAIRGKQAVDKMIQSIVDISRSNEDIMSEIQASNREISQIVNVINEIGNKTKVINEIVFQTKLLSFNASVEAARAGEHGKGFAVVAEEVGNLAQMSGNAAKEITTMLESSIQKVEATVNQTKAKVESLVLSGKQKVEAGSETAENCGKILDEIVANVARVAQMVEEIASGSKEQSQGVMEINKAMSQMDQVTQQNAEATQQSATAASTLNQQVYTLQSIVQKLVETVEGKKGSEDQPVALSHVTEQGTARAA